MAEARRPRPLTQGRVLDWASFIPKGLPADACWPWQGTIDRSGFGQAGRGNSAHRLLYQMMIGPIPDGLHLDHVCHTRDMSCPGGPTCPHRACCNPSHLEAVTPEENTRRGAPARRTHCPKGHAYAEHGIRRASGKRTCRECSRIRVATLRGQGYERPEQPGFQCRECGKPGKRDMARGLCNACYLRWYRARKRPGVT